MGWQQPTYHEREISAEAYRECAETVHQGVCHLPHMQIPGHDPEQGDEVVLPAVHDLSLLVQCPDHQDRFPGRHWEEKVTSSQNHLEDPCLGCLDHHPGHPGFATSRLSVFIWPGLFFWISTLLLRIVANIQLYTWFGPISTQVVMSKGLEKQKSWTIVLQCYPQSPG